MPQESPYCSRCPLLNQKLILGVRASQAQGDQQATVKIGKCWLADLLVSGLLLLLNVSNKSKPSTGRPAGHQQNWKILACKSLGVWFAITMVISSMNKASTGRPAGRRPVSDTLACWSLGGWLAININININSTKRKETSRPPTKLENVGLLVSWCLACY